MVAWLQCYDRRVGAIQQPAFAALAYGLYFSMGGTGTVVAANGQDRACGVQQGAAHRRVGGGRTHMARGLIHRGTEGMRDSGWHVWA